MHRFYTTYETAHLLGVSLPTVVNWITARRLKAHRTPGGHRRIAREDLAAFVMRHGMPIPPELADVARAPPTALVVGDDEPGRSSAATELERAGLVVEEAAPGFAAGAAAARLRPNLVVLIAPGPDGGDTLLCLRADRELRHVPVIVVGLPEWVEQLRARGSAQVLAQPLSSGAVAQAALLALSLGGASGRRIRRA
jgi:excisionase family DNA binding protein